VAYWIVLLLADASFTIWQTRIWLLIMVQAQLEAGASISPLGHVAIGITAIEGPPVRTIGSLAELTGRDARLTASAAMGPAAPTQGSPPGQYHSSMPEGITSPTKRNPRLWHVRMRRCSSPWHDLTTG